MAMLLHAGLEGMHSLTMLHVSQPNTLLQSRVLVQSLHNHICKPA